jgi:hypothetical protein
MGPISTGANYVGNKLAEDKRDSKIKEVRHLHFFLIYDLVSRLHNPL